MSGTITERGKKTSIGKITGKKWKVWLRTTRRVLSRVSRRSGVTRGHLCRLGTGLQTNWRKSTSSNPTVWCPKNQ
jgi:hypothetical protein